MKDGLGSPVTMVRGLCPRDCIRWGVDGTVRTVGDAGAVGHAERMRPTRPGGHANTGRRGRRPLRVGRATNAAAYDVMCAVPSRRTKWCAGGARGIAYVGGGREAGAPFASWSKSVSPNGCVYPAPEIPQPRCTEDGAPYGRQRNRGCGIQRNGCGKPHPKLPSHLTAPLKHTLSQPP